MILAKYIRLSSADEDAHYGDKSESNSVRHQRMLLDHYLDTHPEFRGWTVLEFQDDGRSGTNFERPGIKALLDKVRRRGIDCVIVKDFSRFGRNYVEVGNYLEQVFPFLGVRFISINDGYDSKDHPYGVAGDINSGLRNIINELYSRDLSQKVKDARQQYARRGQCVAAYPIYGYVKSAQDRRMLIIDEPAAETVRRIFEWYIAGQTPAEIARRLNWEKVATPSQRKRELGSKRQSWNSQRPQNEWEGTAIIRILHDERYTGKLIGLKTTRMELGNQNSSRKQAKEDWVVVPNAFEPIVTQECYDMAQAQLSKLRRTPQRQKPGASIRLFTRKLKCGECGLALHRHEIEQGVYFSCGGSAWNSGKACRSIRLFEKDLIRTILASIRFQAQLAKKSIRQFEREERSKCRNQNAVWERKRRIQMKLEQLSEEKAQAFLRYDRGEFSRREFDKICVRLDQEAFSQRIKLQEMDSGAQYVQDDMIRSSQGELDVLAALSNLRTLDRATVEKLIRHIQVYEGNRIEICWNFSDSYVQFITKEEHLYEGK